MEEEFYFSNIEEDEEYNETDVENDLISTAEDGFLKGFFAE